MARTEVSGIGEDVQIGCPEIVVPVVLVAVRVIVIDMIVMVARAHRGAARRRRD